MIQAGNDIRIAITCWEPYARFLPLTIRLYEKFWSDHPPIEIVVDAPLSAEIDRQLPKSVSVYQCHSPGNLILKFREYLNQTTADFVVFAHEDYAICGPVKQVEFDLCCDSMRTPGRDARPLSCSLGWERCKKAPHNIYPLRILDPCWAWVVNFQMRIWSRDHLLQLLRYFPEHVNIRSMEQCCGGIYRQWFVETSHKAIAWPVADPTNPSDYLDETDKNNWIIPYHNLQHFEQFEVRHAKWVAEMVKELGVSTP